MAKRAKKRPYKSWTTDDLKELKQHSREKTPVAKIASAMKRTEATIRMKAYQLGFRSVTGAGRHAKCGGKAFCSQQTHFEESGRHIRQRSELT